MSFIVPIILILTSIGIFFGYIDPNYKGDVPADSSVKYQDYSIQALQQVTSGFNEIAQNSTNIIQKRDTLIAKKKNISTEDTDRLEKLLPSNIDNIRLIIEIGKIATGRGLTLRNVSVGNFNGNNAQAAADTNTTYGTLSLSFTVTSNYNNFLNFLSDLEDNLRIIDVTGISFNATDSGNYDFNVTLNTYWLK